MIHLFTGLPGAGKTLYALGFVMREQKKWNDAHPDKPRDVYYSGVRDLLISGWIKFDPLKTEQRADEEGGLTWAWSDVPDGSFVFIDEAQNQYRPRANGSVVPAHVMLGETHRHHGYDINLVTQHPGLIDANMRKLAGLHFHSIRKWGAQASTVHEWQGVQAEPSSRAAKDQSVKHHYLYDKSLYGMYHSAEVHTVQKRVPAKIYFLIFVPLALLAAAYFIHGFYDKQAHADKQKGMQNVSSGTVGTQSNAQREKTPQEKLQDWYIDQQPRVQDLPSSAPKYDKVMTAVTAPKPAACVEWPKKGCRCYTQQATRMDVSEKTCKLIVERGWFDDTLPERGRDVALNASPVPQQQPFRSAPGQAVQAGQPVAVDRAPVDYQATLDTPPAVDVAPGPPRQATVPANSPWRAK
ncbi:MAG: hypothetical protein JWN73_36 [Betaproteobacteria bacterium]|nr:hypothetical protein [Betaproteobacteria bacterium]